MFGLYDKMVLVQITFERRSETGPNDLKPYLLYMYIYIHICVFIYTYIL